MISRIVSALIAVAALIGIRMGLGSQGLMIISALAVALGMVEYTKLKLPAHNTHLVIRLLFFVLSGAVLAAGVFRPDLGMLVLAICSVIICSTGVLSASKKDSLHSIQSQLMLAILGLVYCAAMPAFALTLLHLPNGEAWFVGLLVIVFTGDTTAYFAGRFFGRHKLHEVISPKKTVEGALGSLVGALIAGFILAKFFIPEVPMAGLIASAAITNVFAQIGDLFESLLKRVSDVKDSGGIMPGHGGILDRLDGVYFSAPVYLALAILLRS